MRLNKPYTSKQYANFAVYCNGNGLIIEDKGDYLEAVDPPEPTVEEKQVAVRSIRNQYLSETDKYMIVDYPITDEQRADYVAYRQYLRTYPETENWYEHNPLSFDEWKAEQVKEAEQTPDDSTGTEPDNQIESSGEPETTQAVQESPDDLNELEADMDAILGTKM